ncbi:hypothetical protein O53_722 [Microcystis aeruginosa TAIHU98]|uniref:Uncharacterized protein n=1 Tax=Microcystis aeruginosa TAIHU98 TaxID=1134457 RepID=L7ECY1_MICAE|nr:hypothetical protein O53_722 [Microcystis aeruginosa TAIHU98]ODV36713.1 hypothetical protein BFG60_3776 [Microcystis aeruginosa NIES-98]
MKILEKLWQKSANTSRISGQWELEGWIRQLVSRTLDLL